MQRLQAWTDVLNPGSVVSVFSLVSTWSFCPLNAGWNLGPEREEELDVSQTKGPAVLPPSAKVSAAGHLCFSVSGVSEGPSSQSHKVEITLIGGAWISHKDPSEVWDRKNAGWIVWLQVSTPQERISSKVE